MTPLRLLAGSLDYLSYPFVVNIALERAGLFPRRVRNTHSIVYRRSKYLACFIFKITLSMMAVFPEDVASATSNNSMAVHTQPLDIETWTEQAAQSLTGLTLGSLDVARGTPVSLAIDLDEHGERQAGKSGDGSMPAYRPRRELVRRDSLVRREALLKGKEGSRRRTRWENGSCHYLAKTMMRIFLLTTLAFCRPSSEQPLGTAPFAERLGGSPDLP